MNPLPREIAQGVFWLGECLPVAQLDGQELHSYNSAYLVAGAERSALVETGIPYDWDVIASQLEGLLRAGVPEPAFLFPTHSEMAHAGGVGHLLERFPKATVHGDISDLHLVFPEFSDRQFFATPGDRFDLGGTEIVVVESVFRDLAYSRWFFDTRRRVLFPGDGFAYSHHHTDRGCGRFVEEAPKVDITTQMARFGLLAFHWTQFVDIEPYVERLDRLVFDELDAAMIAPTHGLPIRDPATTMAEIRAGLRAMTTVTAPHI